jgi:hypothetical protein
VEFKEIGWSMTGFHLAQDRDLWQALVYMVMNIRVPKNVDNFLNTLGNVGFPRTLPHGVSYRTGQEGEARDMKPCRALVYTAMNLRFP